MKRKLLPILFLSLYSGAAMAQVTLTTATSNPVSGEDYQVYYNLDSIPEPGVSGANITWDFSGWASNGTDTIGYVACSANPDCGTFPDASVYRPELLTGNYISDFINTSNNAETIVGKTSSPQTVVFTDGEDIFRFPFAYNNTYTDTFAAMYYNNSSSGNGTVPVYRTGSITVTYDGYGTLLLPYTTLNNVARVHRLEIFQDSMNLEGEPEVGSYHSDTYSWYTIGYGAELMYISHFSFPWISGTAVYYTKHTTTDVSNVNYTTDVTLFPNPANGVVNIHYGNANGNSIHISIADVTGREVAVIDGTNSQQVQYNTGSLQAGLYFVRLQTDNGTITKKLEVL